MDGRLCFSYNTDEDTVEIWGIEENSSCDRFWIERHSIFIDDEGVMMSSSGLETLGMGDGELFGKDYDRVSEDCVYVPSFVSLKNCKSEIFENKELKLQFRNIFEKLTTLD